MNYYLSYGPYGDICTFFILIIFFFVRHSAFTVKNRRNYYMNLALYTVLFSTVSSILYMFVVKYLGLNYKILIYLLRDISHIALLHVSIVFVRYISEMFQNEKESKIFKRLSITIYVLLTIAIISTPLTKLGFYIDANNVCHENIYTDPFTIGYAIFSIILTIQMIFFKKNINSRAYISISFAMFVSFTLMALELLFDDSTFRCFCYILPIMIVYVLFHSTSYDIDTGTLDLNSFYTYVNNLRHDNRNFYVVSLTFEGSNSLEDFLKKIKNELLHFNEKFVKHIYIFRLNDRRFAAIYLCQKDEDFIDKIYPTLNKEFLKKYKKYGMDYKVVVFKSSSLFEESKYYCDYINFIENKIKNNTFYLTNSKDLSDYLRHLNIEKELYDINKKKDLNDNRIKVYCQPIYNTKLKKFTTAESLMRMEIESEGFIYPDLFIPIAEENDLIHQMSLIILNKVCKETKNLIKNGYDIDRVSVNFSTKELKSEKFFEEVKNIIKKNNLSYSKIGLEITESQDVIDCEEVISNLKKLSELGIKIYLDDFGTGYSNFERIMKMPFDIIKFDKSLLDNSNVDKKFKLMTSSLSTTYNKLGYDILFEGVETEKDAEICTKEMNAKYLQGYNFSKPIPIEDLAIFFNNK